VPEENPVNQITIVGETLDDNGNIIPVPNQELQIVYTGSPEDNQKFANLIQGKNVVLVGPAAYLEGSRYGKSIDEKDVVVRINRSFETAERMPEDVGSRTDIIYSCLLETHRNAGFLDFEKIKKANVKMICAPGFRYDFQGGINLYSSHIHIEKSTWKKLNDAKYKVRLVLPNVDEFLKEQTQTRPNTGFLAIYDILAFNPKSLTIHGFTFYLDGFIKGSKEGVEKEKGCSEEEFANLAFKSKRHNQKNMWEFAKKTLPNQTNVILDDTMKKILSLETFGRDEFYKND